MAFVINILLNFFTAFQQDIEWRFKLKEIAKAYIKSYFLFDMVSTLPNLITLENPDYYWLKMFRYIHFRKFLQFINIYAQKIFNRIGVNKQLSERIFYFIT